MEFFFIPCEKRHLAYSKPVLMFLYPLAIVLILLTLAGRLFGSDRTVLRWTVGLTAAAAAFDFLRALPEGARALLHLDPAVALAEARLPLFAQGFGWVCPAALGFAVGLAMRSLRRRRPAP